MKTTFIPVLILTVLCALLSGGCGISSTSSNDSSMVTVTVGGNGKTASLTIRPATLLARTGLKLKQAWRENLAFASPFPGTVKRFRVTATAADMAPQSLTLDLPSGDQEVTGVFEVPNGAGRLFTGELLNLDNKPVYRKTDGPYDLKGDPVTVSFSAWEVTAPLGTVVVIGTVKDSSTGSPLSGATVTFGAYEPVTTSPVGMYFIEVEPGSYSVSAAKAGYTTATQNRSVEPSPEGEFITIDLTLSP